MLENTPIARENDIVIQETTNEVLVYDLKMNKAFCLNETSALIWQLCNGKNTVKEISQLLTKETKSPVSEDLVWMAINELKKDNLIANSETLENKFAGISRREVIRKVGLTSLVALPLITSLVVPTAAMAGSIQPGTVPENGPCNTASDCAPNPAFQVFCCRVTSPNNPTICRAAGVGCIPGTSV